MKEADEIKLHSFPQGSQWRGWRSSTIHSIVSAAGRQDDKALEWILKVEKNDEDCLNDPGEGWIALDRKLAAALTKICHGELGRELTQASTMALNNDQVARGRTLLAIVFCYYASGNSGQVLYDMTHLCH